LSPPAKWGAEYSQWGKKGERPVCSRAEQGECKPGPARLAEAVTEPGSIRSCSVFGAHLGKGCASSKESPRFSKMRTSRKRCASSNQVRIFGRALALHPVPLTRKVAQAQASASVASTRILCMHLPPAGESNFAAGAASLSRYAPRGKGPHETPRTEIKRAAPLDSGTAPHERD
jgi:hypothetical protein